MAWNAKDGLDERAEDGRTKQDELLGESYLESVLFERTDRRVVEYFIEQEEEYNRVAVDAALDKADELAGVYDGSPHADRALDLFFGYASAWEDDVIQTANMKNLLALAEGLADEETRHGRHPCQNLALEIWYSGEPCGRLSIWLARRLGEEYLKAKRYPYWCHDRAALAADGVSTIAEAVELSLTKKFRTANRERENAAWEAGKGKARFDDQMRTVWDRFKPELLEQYGE